MRSPISALCDAEKCASPPQADYLVAKAPIRAKGNLVAIRKLAMTILTLLALNTQAITITVDTTSDLATDNCGAGNACSLRGALMAVNATPASDVIAFNIPESDPGFQSATGHWRISIVEPGPSLPTTGPSVIVDGYSQPGAIANTNTPSQGGLNGTLKIEVRGASPGGNANYAFQLDSDQPSVLRGLAINNYREAQVYLRGAGAHRIEGCYLGTDITGNTAQLVSNGVSLSGSGPYVIGGVLPGERNLISGLNNAFLTRETAADGVRIQGNLIGTNAAGTAVVGNIFGMLLFRMTNSLIGGSDPDARNVFSGHSAQAIIFQVNAPGAFNGTRFHGNYFGTDVFGTRALGNDLQGGAATIQVNANAGTDCGVEIGGPLPGEENLIAFSAGVGIRNGNCLGLQSAHNRYYGNQGIAFDNIFGNTGASGATPNDAGDGDAGGNRLQNFPEITLPVDFLPSGGSSVDVQYLLDTEIANASYPITIHFYRGACGGGSGSWLASTSVSAAQSQQPQTFTLVAADGSNVLPLVATAVDAAGNTSEFSPMVGDDIFHSDFEDSLAPAAVGSCR